MKRNCSLLTITVLACLILAPAITRAAEIKIGAAAMYDLWKPAYLIYETGAEGNLYGKLNKCTMTGSFMLGPTFQAVIANGWSISLQGLFGVTSNKFKYSSFQNTTRLDFLNFFTVHNSKGSGTINIRKHSIDLGAEYALHKYVNLLLGCRFSYNQSKGSGNLLTIQNAFLYGVFYLGLPSRENKESTAWYLGPAVGLGFKGELYKGLSLAFGLSLLVQGGEYAIKMNYSGIKDRYSVSHIDVGPDLFLKLSYIIASANVELWIGGRYMLLTHFGVDENHKYNLRFEDVLAGRDITSKGGWLDGKIEHSGGVMVGASYNFKI